MGCLLDRKGTNWCRLFTDAAGQSPEWDILSRLTALSFFGINETYIKQIAETNRKSTKPDDNLTPRSFSSPPPGE